MASTFMPMPTDEKTENSGSNAQDLLTLVGWLTKKVFKTVYDHPTLVVLGALYAKYPDAFKKMWNWGKWLYEHPPSTLREMLADSVRQGAQNLDEAVASLDAAVGDMAMAGQEEIMRGVANAQEAFQEGGVSAAASTVRNEVSGGVWSNSLWDRWATRIYRQIGIGSQDFQRHMMEYHQNPQASIQSALDSGDVAAIESELQANPAIEHKEPTIEYKEPPADGKYDGFEEPEVVGEDGMEELKGPPARETMDEPFDRFAEGKHDIETGGGGGSSAAEEMAEADAMASAEAGAAAVNVGNELESAIESEMIPGGAVAEAPAMLVDTLRSIGLNNAAEWLSVPTNATKFMIGSGTVGIAWAGYNIYASAKSLSEFKAQKAQFEEAVEDARFKRGGKHDIWEDKILLDMESNYKLQQVMFALDTTSNAASAAAAAAGIGGAIFGASTLVELASGVGIGVAVATLAYQLITAPWRVKEKRKMDLMLNHFAALQEDRWWMENRGVPSQFAWGQTHGQSYWNSMLKNDYENYMQLMLQKGKKIIDIKSFAEKWMNGVNGMLEKLPQGNITAAYLHASDAAIHPETVINEKQRNLANEWNTRLDQVQTDEARVRANDANRRAGADMFAIDDPKHEGADYGDALPDKVEHTPSYKRDVHYLDSQLVNPSKKPRIDGQYYAQELEKAKTAEHDDMFSTIQPTDPAHDKYVFRNGLTPRYVEHETTNHSPHNMGTSRGSQLHPPSHRDLTNLQTNNDGTTTDRLRAHSDLEHAAMTNPKAGSRADKESGLGVGNPNIHTAPDYGKPDDGKAMTIYDPDHNVHAMVPSVLGNSSHTPGVSMYEPGHNLQGPVQPPTNNQPQVSQKYNYNEKSKMWALGRAAISGMPVALAAKRNYLRSQGLMQAI